MRTAAAFLLPAIVLAACSKTNDLTASGRHSYTIPHVLRCAISEEPAGLNSHLIAQAAVSSMSALTAAWLIRSGPHGEPVPELAAVVPTLRNGGISRDGRTITYRLRRGVVWSDGAPFNADDVLFSTRVVLNPANNEISRAGWDDIAKIEEPNKSTIIYRLKRPYAGFLYQYFSTYGANPSILPKHVLGGLPNINHAAYNALPIGIGPFKYVQWRRADFVEMVANPRYFRGAPKLQRILFKIVPDRNAALNALAAHEVDLWAPPASYYERALEISGVRVLKRAGSGFLHVDFNLSHAVLADPAVRRAIRFAIDRPTLDRKISNGLDIVQDNIVSPINPSFDPRVPTTPFDIAAANRLLDRAGWRRGADGVRAKGKLRLSLFFAIPAGTPDYDRRVELIRSWLQQIGVQINTKRYPSPLMFAPAGEGGIIYGGRFDLVTFVWSSDPLGDLSGYYACSQLAPSGQNVTRYCNRRVDAAMAKFSTLYTFRRRQPYANFIQEQLQRDAPTIVLGIPDAIVAYNSDLRNFHPNDVVPFDNFINVDI
jgi:peptide/nickel transport system substrate-binding protein